MSNIYCVSGKNPMPIKYENQVPFMMILYCPKIRNPSLQPPEIRTLPRDNDAFFSPFCIEKSGKRYSHF